MNFETNKGAPARPLSSPRTEKLSLAEALACARETRALRIGSELLATVPVVFSSQFPGKTAIVVADQASFEVAGRAVQDYLQGAGLSGAPAMVFTEAHLKAEYEFVEKLEAVLAKVEAIPVAVGSGTINDLTKLVSHHLGRPYLCVATAASMDGYTAFGASITYQGAKQTFNCPAPQAVLADIGVIRTAPEEMTASGYADLQAKLTAGADWILADALGAELIDPKSWSIVQGGLQDALADPAGARARDPKALYALTEGLMLGGFAMQWSKSSRPASGAEHQFSHLWDMEHHTHQGEAPSHGFKVGIATLAIASLYEKLLELPLQDLDVEACCARWPEKAAVEKKIREDFAKDDFLETAVTETLVKHCSREELRVQLFRLKAVWPELRNCIRAQLPSSAELARRLVAVGAPVKPEEIGITPERLRRSFRRAYHIRRRFTVLDLAMRTGTLEQCLAALFGPEKL